MTDTPKTRDDLAWLMASSRWAKFIEDIDPLICDDFPGMPSKDRGELVAEMYSVLDALTAAGLAVVQCIPTDEMVKAGIAGAKTAGYTVHPNAAHFALNAGNKAGNILGGR